MNTNNILHNSNTPYQYDEDMNLLNYHITGLGMIIKVAPDYKTCSVQGFDAKESSINTYDDLEILYLNNFTRGLTGSPCLIIGTYTNILSVREQVVGSSLNPYSTKTLKVIPLSFGCVDPSIGYDNDDTFTIESEQGDYRLRFSPDGFLIEQGNINVQCNKGNISLSLPNALLQFSDNNTSSIEYFVNNKTAYKLEHLADGTIKSYYGAKAELTDAELDGDSEFVKWTWVKELNINGQWDLIQLDNQQKELVHVQISNAGNVDLKVTPQDANVATHVSITQRGAISITNKKATLSIDTSGNISITGDGKVTLGNNKSLLDIMSDLYDALSSLQTKGSPAAQAADPTWISTKLNAWKTTYEGVLS